MFDFAHYNLTDQFNRAYASLSLPVRNQCLKALRFLLTNPSHPGLNIKPIQPSKTYWEARLNRSDRLIFRPEANVAHIIDVVDHDDLSKYG